MKKMRRTLRAVALSALPAALLALSPAGPVWAETISITADAVTFKKAGDEQIATILRFTATTDTYTLTAPSGEYSEASELMAATGDAERPAVLTKGGDDAFEVSAEQQLTIAFEDETLSAKGNVTFRSDDLDARSDELVVDRFEALQARIDDLTAAVSQEQTLNLVQQFLAKITPEDRLILLTGNVRVVREDSTMESAWMLVNESDQNELISVADAGRQLTLTITSQEEDEEPTE